MPRMSKKRKLELSFFLNDRERVAYNDLCRKCQHECKLQFTFFLFIKAVDGSHIIFKSPLNPHVAHVAVALEPFALQAAGCLKGLLKYPPPFIDKTSFIIIKGLFLPHGYVNPYIVRMVFCAISFLQQPFCQSIVFLMFFFSLMFAFEVKNADGSYCETFTSPKSGVIEVKGLRVGIYTVTEISNRASKDYIIPDAATVEIKADETATVQFFNEKPEKPTTPDNPDNPKTPSNPSTPSNPDKAVPQTGDDNFIFLYGGLLALAVIGGGLFAVVYFKKGKYSRNTPKRKAVGIVVVSFCGLLALGSEFLMVRDLNQYSESAGAYEDIASHVELPEQTEAPEDDNVETEPAGEDTFVVLPTVDFDALRETGPDIIGWLTLPDTAINYPVTQTDDNEYYLHHLYDGTYNKTGCLFADYENKEDFSDRNTIIYGHNMRDGSMFATLNEYDEQSYFDGHPQMYLVTPGGGYIVEIFTAFVAKPSESGSDTSPWRLSFKDDGAYTTWLSEMADRSVIETDVTVTSSDKVLTLSTCPPGGASRFIVMGKLMAVND